jgi:hypothetical protein
VYKNGHLYDTLIESGETENHYKRVGISNIFKHNFMKRIIAAVAVITIVSSALAFNTKKGTKFCASTTQNSGCAIVTKDEVGGTANFFKDPNFDGVHCSSTVCGTATRLVNEN